MTDQEKIAILKTVIKEAVEHDSVYNTNPNLLNTLEYGLAKIAERDCQCIDAEMPSDDDCSGCVAKFERGAISAGIPKEVVRGEKKLKDCFSQEYINHKAGKK